MRSPAVSGTEPSLIDRANVAAGEMYDIQGQREQAVARYRQVIAGGRDGDSPWPPRKYLRHPYQVSRSCDGTNGPPHRQRSAKADGFLD